MERFAQLFLMIVAVALLASTGLAATVNGADSAIPDGGEPNVRATLMSEVTSVEPGKPFWVGLRQQIKPGWHTYWRNAGDAGAPTRLYWDLPQGFTVSEIHWPFPERIPYGSLINFGYHDEVLLLVQITPPENLSGSQIELVARAEWLVCEEICIPEDASLKIILPVGETAVRDERYRDLFASTRLRLPQQVAVKASAEVVGENISLVISLPGFAENRIQRVKFFPFNEDVIDHAAAQDSVFSESGIQVSLKQGWEFDPESSSMDGIIVVTEDVGDGLQTAIVVRPTIGAATVGIGLLNAMIFAFLGGMILNLMPCVFPVLSIKILSLVDSSAETSIRVHGAAYFVGVVASFLVVAIVLLALRAAGEQIGWGFQLQSPTVVALLAYLFVVIGFSLSGFLQVGLSWTGVGDSFTRNSGYLGSFSTGVLASVVAAPCTAPFMGAALGFALTQSGVTALTVFAALGAGMATPYCALCVIPGLLNLLPKPGPWMLTLKEFLAFPMYASAVWLIWVLNIQAGTDGVLYVLSGLLVLSFAIWLSQRATYSYLVKVLAVVLVLSSVALTALLEAQNEGASPSEESGIVPYSKQALSKARREGPVFVNFTAAWCITCKVNELAALQSDRVMRAFQEKGITYLRGDWTNEDPVITAALAEFSRTGVPLYLLYPGDGGEARVLSQILTENIMLEAISAL